MPFQELGARTSDGKSNIAVIPNVQDGKPAVLMVLLKDSTFDTTLDGKPAFAFNLVEERPDLDNAPWELGHLLADNWEKAKKMASQGS